MGGDRPLLRPERTSSSALPDGDSAALGGGEGTGRTLQDLTSLDQPAI